MKKIFIIKSLKIIAICSVISLLACLQFFLSSTKDFPELNISAQDAAFNVNHELINVVHAGEKRLIVAIIWIETLMNSDLEHYQKKDLNSWMWHRFNALINLDEKFYEVYLYGGQYLSIVKDDLVGAADIYRRGLEIFPDDFQLNFHAGFNYYFEMNKPSLALPLFEKAAMHPDVYKFAPYLPSLLSKMRYDEFGASEESFLLALNLYQHQPDKNSPVAQKLLNTVYALRCNIDVECLNTHKNNCKRRDLFNNPYPMIDGRYVGNQNCDLKINKK